MKYLILSFLFIFSACVPEAQKVAPTTASTATASATPQITVASTATISEGVGASTIAISMNRTSSQTVSIPYTVYGTATSGADYTIVGTSSISISSGSLTGTKPFTVSDDALIEGTETMIVVFGTPTNATIGSNITQTIFIVDNDVTSTLPDLNFSVASATISEGGGTYNATINLSSAATYPIYVPVTLSVSGTATNNVDYVVASSYVTIAAGSTNATLSIAITDDSVYEGVTNENLILNIGTTVGAVVGATSSLTLGIIENDAAPSLGFTSATQTIAEATSTINVSVALTQATSVPITFTIATNAGSTTACTNTLAGCATQVGDFTFPQDGLTLTIPANTLNYTTTITQFNDTVYEGVSSEAITLDVTSADVAIAGNTQQVISLTDNEAVPEVRFVITSATYPESVPTVTIQARATVASQSAFSVLYTLNGATTATSPSDYSLSGGGVIPFSAYQTETSITATLVNDVLAESTEYLILDLSPATAVANGYTDSATYDSYTLTLTSEDPLPVLSLSSTGSTVSESTTTVTFNAKLNNISGSDVTANLTLTGTATNTSDYSVTPAAISILAGTTSQAITVTITNDTLDENTEAAIFTLDTVSNATLGSNSSYTLNITDNDSPPVVSFTTSPSTSEAENSGSTFQVTASPSAISGLSISIPYTITGSSTATAGTDFTHSGTTGTLTIAAGATSGAISLPILDDALYEGNETIAISFGTPSNSTLSSSAVTLTITEDDAAPVYGFASTTGNGFEGNSLTVNVTTPNAAGTTVTIPVTLTGTATSGNDYTISSGTITFPSGSTSQAFTVVMTEDTTDEVNETVIATLGTPTLGTTSAPAITYTGTINDDDIYVNFSTSSSTITENSTQTVTANITDVTNSNLVPAGADITVALSLGGTASNATDYTVSPSSISIAATASTGSISLITTDDIYNERAETVNFSMGTLTSASANYQIHLGTTIPTTVVTIADNDPIVDMGLGYQHSCAVISRSDGDANGVKCWGLNSSYQLANVTTSNNLGDATNEMGSNLSFANTASVGVITKIASGYAHSCAINGTNSVICWGDNTYGQLGDGTTTSTSSPVTVNLGAVPTQIVAGDYHTCALMTGGTMKCWGQGTYGQLGSDSNSSLTSPTTVLSLTGISHITAGASHTCAVISGSVYCFGKNDYGQLGQDDTTNRGDNAGEMAALSADPVTFTTYPITVSQVHAGTSHTCVYSSTSNAIRCFGKNSSGQLGLNDTTSYGSSATYSVDSVTDIAIVGSSNFSVLKAGGDTTCAIDTSDNLYCFGSNSYGQLGIGSTTNRGASTNDLNSLPETDLDSSNIPTNVFVGTTHTCAIYTNTSTQFYSTKCWGRNNAGQLGQGDVNNRGDGSNEMGSNLSPLNL